MHYKLNNISKSPMLTKYIIGVVVVVVLVGVSVQYFVRNSLAIPYLLGSGSALDQQFDETPVTAEDINNYHVKSNMPRVVYVPSLDIKARIFPVGLTTKNAIGSPKNVNDAAWYSNSELPGNKGVSFIDAHTGANQSKGIFTNIYKLSNGNKVIVEMGDGQKTTFYVQSSEEIKLEDVDMQKILTAKTNNPELVLMSCAGRYDKKIKTYTNRYVVYLRV